MEIQRKTEQQISFKDTKTKRKKGNIHFSVSNDKFNRTKIPIEVCVFLVNKIWNPKQNPLKKNKLIKQNAGVIGKKNRVISWFRLPM